MQELGDIQALTPPPQKKNSKIGWSAPNLPGRNIDLGQGQAGPNMKMKSWKGGEQKLTSNFLGD